MVSLFITGVIIAYVVRFLIRKQEENNQGQQRYQGLQQQSKGQYARQSAGQAARQAAGQAAQQNSQRPMQQQSYQRPPQQTVNQQANGRYSRMSNPKQNPNRPIRPAQGTGPVASKKNQTRPDDILSRATANVRENEADELMLRTETGALVTDEPSELIRQVNDLIIMGYQADMSFERDFIAEGVELMNRYEISTEL